MVRQTSKRISTRAVEEQTSLSAGKRGWTCVVLMNVFVQTKQITERWWYIVIVVSKHKQSNMASLFISCKGKIDSCLKRGPVCSLNFEKVMILIILFFSLLIGASLVVYLLPHTMLRGSPPKSGPLDFATKNTFPLFFVGEEALVGVY